MATAPPIGTAPAPPLTGASRRPVRHGGAPAAARSRVRPSGHALALAVVLAGSLTLRLWGVHQGLPYSYNVDEATHFVPRAVSFLSQDLNPNYFLNPPAYSYLLGIAFELWFGSADAVTRTLASDPSSLYVVARVVAALLGTGAVWLTYLTGRRLWSPPAGLAAAAVLGAAFLPIFYSHLALNDVPALLPVALSLWGVAGIVRFGRRRDYLISGLGIGLAAATKYTGGITLVCLLAAGAVDGSTAGARVAARRLVGALLVALAAFVLANPYSVLDPAAFWDGVSQQASQAAGQDPVKLGTSSGSGIGYYVWSFTWGFGWGPSLAALAGAALLLVRRRLALGLVLLPAPLIFLVLMGTQQRFFGRWIMPLFPLAALLAGWTVAELARWLPMRLRPVMPRVVVLAGLSALLLAQSLVWAVHDNTVLARTDTRSLVRTWMVDHVPAGEKIVLEPVVPGNWATDVGVSLPWTGYGDRWYRFPTQFTDLDRNGRLLPAGRRRFVSIDQYERTLRPQLLDEYVTQGYCWLVIGSLQAGRALSEPREAPRAVAYYAALAARARLVFHVSPYAPGAHPVPFNFDWSIDYFPRQYARPGPEMSVYRLRGGRCGTG